MSTADGASARTKMSALFEEWGPTVLAGMSDAAVAGGFVPREYVSGIRFILLYGLFRRSLPAFLVALLLPRLVPVSVVFLLQKRWLSFRGKMSVLSEGIVNSAAAFSTGVGSNHVAPFGGGSEGSTTQGSRANVAPEEVSGYDVSGTSDGEVVELSSWKESSESLRQGNTARRRML